MPGAQSAEEVVRLLPESLVEELANVAALDDENVVLDILERNCADNFGLRGLYVNTGMIKVPSPWAWGLPQLKSFGREVVQACREYFDREFADDPQSVLRRLELQRQSLDPAVEIMH